MKNPFKIGVATLALLPFLSIHSNAQTTKKTESYRSSIGADGGIPVGPLKDNFDWNPGVSKQGDFPMIKDQLFATGNGVIIIFFVKNTIAGLNDLHVIPLKGGLKYFLIEYIYIQGETVVSFIANKNNLGLSKSVVFCLFATSSGFA
ncbi:MAG: hypothetical protein JWQ63_2872 [Mucilaginibacter sp.]|nr:hypothetical protein [Mucilaginibacter sp.]